MFFFVVVQALKKISETDLISEKARKAMEEGNLEKAQELYCDYLVTLDQYLVPPYQVCSYTYYMAQNEQKHYARYRITTRSSRASGSASG